MAHHSRPLGQRLRAVFTRAEAERRDVEDRWLKDLRQYKGVYDPDVAARLHPKRSKAFLRITRNKVRLIDARLGDLLFPGSGEKNWAIEPTPEPRLDPELDALIIEQLRLSLGRDPLPREVQAAAVKTAENSCRVMERIMEDQLAEAGYREVIADVLHSGNLYGTGVLKGPLVEARTRRRWAPDPETGTWGLTSVQELLPFVEFVPVWDVYPDMSASSLGQARYVMQRHVMSKADLQALARRGDFDGAAIEAHLAANPHGDAGLRDHESQLLAMAGPDATSPEREGKYEVLEYWGLLSAEDVFWPDATEDGQDCGKDIDSGEEVEATAWMLGDEVIKLAPSPLPHAGRPYYFYYYDKDETCIFGEGAASVMRDPQTLFNASVRALLDNAAIAAGPQLEVNQDLLPETEDPTDVHPFRIWLRTGLGADAATPAVRVFSLPSHTQEFMAMAQLFAGYADQATAVPGLAPEIPAQAAHTARGLSMALSASGVTLKDQVRRFDDGVTRPFIAALYHWNMSFANREEAKGDYEIRARGWTSLVARELYVEQLDAFAKATANSLDGPLVDRRELLTRMAQARDLPDGVVKSAETLAREQVAAQLQKK